MTSAYVVTEGQFDADVLKKLLPPRLVQSTTFVVGSGRYSAQSIAGSILATKRRPVALVLDADGQSDRAVQEHEDFLNSLLGQAAADTTFKIFIFRPEIEAIFFHDPAIFTKLTGIDWNSTIEADSRYEPKQVLIRLLGHNYEYLLDIMDESTINALQQYPLISNLTHFLAQVVAQPT